MANTMELMLILFRESQYYTAANATLSDVFFDSIPSSSNYPKHVTGNRVPMVTFRSDSIRLVVVVKTDTDPYYYVDVVDSLPLNIKSAVRIETIGTLLRMFSDNVEKINQIINT